MKKLIPQFLSNASVTLAITATSLAGTVASVNAANITAIANQPAADFVIAPPPPYLLSTVIPELPITVLVTYTATLTEEDPLVIILFDENDEDMSFYLQVLLSLTNEVGEPISNVVSLFNTGIFTISETPPGIEPGLVAFLTNGIGNSVIMGRQLYRAVAGSVMFNPIVNATLDYELVKVLGQDNFIANNAILNNIGQASVKVTSVVPEPLTILGTATAAGFGAFFKRELNKKKKKEELL